MKGKATAASPGRGRERRACRVLSLRVHASLGVPVCRAAREPAERACSRACERAERKVSPRVPSAPKQSQILTPKNRDGDSGFLSRDSPRLQLPLLQACHAEKGDPHKSGRGDVSRGGKYQAGNSEQTGSEVLAVAFVMSPRWGPPPAQDPTRVRAEPTARSKRGGFARRLHGPFLRKLCPAGQALIGKDGEAVTFQNLKIKKLLKLKTACFFFLRKTGKRTIPGFGWISSSALLYL